MPHPARWPARSCQPGLLESGKLEPAIFSPATKAETGHDENITVAQVRERLGDEVTHTLESMARAVYALGEKISPRPGHHHRRHQIRIRPRRAMDASS